MITILKEAGFNTTMKEIELQYGNKEVSAVDRLKLMNSEERRTFLKGILIWIRRADEFECFSYYFLETIMRYSDRDSKSWDRYKDMVPNLKYKHILNMELVR